MKPAAILTITRDSGYDSGLTEEAVNPDALMN